jgi:hypothetical protein
MARGTHLFGGATLAEGDGLVSPTVGGAYQVLMLSGWHA